ncbi:hypothetical protein EAK82_23505 [Salmonella enterica]|uniref:Uncharacterized protein n=1 Tax=Salmonella enterica TaxID=28901 RepID=A0A403N2V7_SALER|nr:hypothetical protein [Salmonella enterica]
MNNKLPEWRKTLNKSVENYQSMRAWYEENPDTPSADQDVDAAAGEIEKLIRQHGVLIVLNLLDEIDELQELRHSCLALRGEIEDVQAQLYEAENRNNADDEELQERRKADSDPVGEFYEDGPLNWYQISDGDRVPAHRRIPLYRHAQPVPVVPEEITDESTEQRLMGRRWAHSFCAGWNACRSAMFRDLSQPVDPQISEYEKIMLQAGNSPVIPDGYVLVPVEPTDEMIVAAMDSDDVTYNESDDTVFYVHHREIYKAMLAAAPQPETNNK